jgi:tryptophan synthase alpha chain
MISANKINNRITKRLKSKENILSVYFTAGYPLLNDTGKIIMLLQKYGADIIEVGIPFSDSLMDGPVIQNANNVALKNGMTMEILFQQLKMIKEKVTIPLILMGSMNPVYQYGFEKFCASCKEAGINGTIIPEMPLKEFNKNYLAMYSEYNLSNIFMITPQTNNERIKLIDESSEGFIYIVSSNSTTGNKKTLDQSEEYFKKVDGMQLRNPCLIGFNVNEKEDFAFALQYSRGAIVGTAFIKELSEGVNETKIKTFLERFKK